MADMVPAWTVVNVTPDVVTNTRGQLVEGFTINVRVMDGHEFRVKVPASDYNPDTVRERIDQVFQNYIGVKTLTGDLIQTDGG